MNREDEGIDWSVTSWEGNRQATLRGWAGLSLLEKFRAVENMEALATDLFRQRREAGLPYIDPDTGELVPRSEGTGGRLADGTGEANDPSHRRDTSRQE